jgi:excisionase family DNA binding protein
MHQHDASPGVAAVRAALDVAQGVDPAVLAVARAVLDGWEAAGRALVPVTRVATELGVSVCTVRRLIAAGELTGVRLGYRTVRVPAGDVSRYLSRRAVTSAKN